MNSIDLPLVKPRDILCLAPFSLPHNFLISIKSSIITLPYIFLNPCFFYRFLSAFENFRTLRTLLSSSLRLHFPRKLSNIASVFSPPFTFTFSYETLERRLIIRSRWRGRCSSSLCRVPGQGIKNSWRGILQWTQQSITKSTPRKVPREDRQTVPLVPSPTIVIINQGEKIWREWNKIISHKQAKVLFQCCKAIIVHLNIRRIFSPLS